MSKAERPLAHQVWLLAPASRRVLDALMADGRPARFVGGCVRDGLLGREPSGDLDLATPELPERVVALLEAAGLGAIPTGLAHGTITAVSDQRRFEITTLRRDVATDGRHAEVAFTESFEADAARRDFTINAMSCDRNGCLFDYFGGQADLAAGRIRFVGPAAQRIAEDFLRILRFFRFFAHFGRPPADAEALQACADAAEQIGQLSGERIQIEMRKLLEAQNPAPVLRLMRETGVLTQVMPGQPAFDRLSKLLALVPDADAWLRLAALLRDEPGKAILKLARRWRLSKRDAERLQGLVEDRLPALAATPSTRRQAIYRLGPEHYRDLVRLAASGEQADSRATLAEALAEAKKWQSRSLPLGGEDVMGLGLPSGPAVGRVLVAVEDWWIANDFAPDHAACLAKAKDFLGTMGDDEAPAAP